MNRNAAVSIDRSTARRNLDGFKSFWQERINAWRERGETATEKKYAQQFWSELFACFGVNASRMDLFEQDARRGVKSTRVVYLPFR